MIAEMRARARGILGGIYPYLLEWIVVAMFVALWTLLTFLLPVPGCPRGYLGPGGVGSEGEHPKCVGGAAGYIDRQILRTHIYHNPTCGAHSGNFDSVCTLSSRPKFLGHYLLNPIAFWNIAGR